MSIRHVALFFDNTSRPETTGTYVRRALGQFTEVEHFLPREAGHVGANAFDFYLHIDDGTSYTLPEHCRPAGLWAIDTHLNLDWFRNIAPQYDVVFAAQKDGAEQLRKHGIAQATWLPLACDPAIHAQQVVPKRFDLCFVGNLFAGSRADLVHLLERHFRNMFVGKRYFLDMARTYSESKLVFNSSIQNDLNMRVFEALCAGSLLLTNDLQGNGQEECFHDGVHLAVYREEEELLDKVRYYLRREETRERIAAAGRAEVIAQHTYRHRCEQLLQTAASQLARKTFSRVAPTLAPTVPTPATPAPTASSPPTLAPTAPTTAQFTADPEYFGHARPELLAAVQADARRILDVGCAAGRFGAAVKARQPAQVVGIEQNAAAAALARAVLDAVHEGDVEQLPLDWAKEPFDAIICGDVLEHLRDPLTVLKRLRAWLATQGRLVVSVPNMRHHSVIRGLIAGHFTYEPSGLLDQTHLRFFTRRELEKLLYRAGFEVQELKVLGLDDYRQWQAQGRPGHVKVGRLHIGGLPAEEAEEFYAYQYLAIASPASPVPWGLTSIILVTFNQLEYTRQCLESLRLVTDEPYELIVVDNGSTDGTVAWLRAQRDIRLVENAENRGFPAAVNQGLQIAQGEQLLLLNNDTLLTTGWLQRLLRALHAEPHIGIVGPCSNCVSGEQQIEVGYEDLHALDGFAWDWGKMWQGQHQETDRLVGFCLLFKRAVMDQIGVLDERFGIGCFEDDDYVKRALAAGFRAVIARDAFVHHFGGRTFLGSGADFAAIMRENEGKFHAKWQATPTPQVAPPRLLAEPAVVASPHESAYALQLVPGTGLLLKRQRIRVSLCMIVRNNEKTIEPCLLSIRPYVDEMILVDTGSTDRTPEIAARLGARVFHFPWCDSFAAARNESLRHASGEWIFWMDSDDTISPENGKKLRALALGAHEPHILGYICQVHCPGAGPKGHLQTQVVDHVKLVRNRPDLRFEFRIHENILPSIRRSRGDVLSTDIFVTHSGYDHTPEGQERKVARDLKLLHLELQDRPGHPFPLFNLGMTYNSIGKYAEAIAYLQQYLQRADPSESPLRKGYAFLVGAHDALGQREQSWQICMEGLRKFPGDAELRFLKAQLLMNRRQWTEAVHTLDDLLAHPETHQFSSVDKGITGFKAKHLLAQACCETGRFDRAERLWREVTAEASEFAQAWRHLGRLLLRLKRLAEAEKLADTIASSSGVEAEAWLLRGRLAAASGQPEVAEEYLLQAAQQDWSDASLLEAVCQALFEEVGVAAAWPVLERQRELTPDDPSIWHHLGVVYCQLGRYAEAILVLEESLRLRPQYAPTQELLEHAQQAASFSK